SGDVDYKAVKKVKKALDIPVIASGDVFSGELAKKMLDETGCDGLAVARGALGNPWIFKELSAFFKNQQVPQRPKREEIVDIMLRHLELSVKVHGEKNGVVLFRKFFSYYTKGFRKVRPLRERICRLKLKREMIEVIENLRYL
ncbi:MAG: tRNA-dihydrouridine synthase, partial [bacterium]